MKDTLDIFVNGVALCILWHLGSAWLERAPAVPLAPVAVSRASDGVIASRAVRFAGGEQDSGPDPAAQTYRARRFAGGEPARQGAGSLRTLSTPIEWRDSLDEARAEAAVTGRQVLIYWTQHDCPPCRRLERDVFDTPLAAAAIDRNWIAVKLDARARADPARRWGVSSTPTLQMVESDWSRRRDLGLVATPERFVAELMKSAELARAP